MPFTAAGWFLIAGFALNAYGFTSNDTLSLLADLGVTLLLLLSV